MSPEPKYPGFLNTLIAVAVTYAIMLLFGVFVWVSLSLQIKGNDLKIVLFGSLVVGFIYGLLLVPLATGVWMALRKVTGEGPVACLSFGAVFGFAVALIGPSFLLTILMGVLGGLVYWLISRAMARRRQGPENVEQVFE